jgi:uncharacterized protein YjdB
VIGRCRVLAALGLGALMSTACIGVGPLDPSALEVQITPPNLLLTAIGAQTQLAFTIGDGVTPPDVAWRSSAPSVATVDSEGTVTAVGDGTATITAESQGMSASTTVTVAATILNVIQVTAQQTDTNTGNNVSTVIITVTVD